VSDASSYEKGHKSIREVYIVKIFHISKRISIKLVDAKGIDISHPAPTTTKWGTSAFITTVDKLPYAFNKSWLLIA
jgi:hypothetical protein